MSAKAALTCGFAGNFVSSSGDTMTNTHNHENAVCVSRQFAFRARLLTTRDLLLASSVPA